MDVKHHVYLLTSTFIAMTFDENPFTCQYEKEDKNAEGFQISQFYWSFLNDIMAVKGLIVVPAHACVHALNSCFSNLHSLPVKLLNRATLYP